MNSHWSASCGLHPALLFPLPSRWPSVYLHSGIMAESWERLRGVHRQGFLVGSPESSLYPTVPLPLTSHSLVSILW